jgi:hypothetical protein
MEEGSDLAIFLGPYGEKLIEIRNLDYVKVPA